MIGPRLAQFLRFAFGAVFMVAVLLGLLASGALEKPNGSKLRIRDVYLWAFGYPADDPDVIHARAQPIALSNDASPPKPVVAEAPPPPPPPPVPQPPKEQAQFTSLLTKFTVPSGPAPNQAALRKIRTERAAAICQQMKERTATDWVGTVADTGSDATGNGFLYIDIGGAQVGTARNAAAEGASRTMILRDSVMASVAATLKAGQTVVFTGDFTSDKQDCLKQANAAAPDAVIKPRYLVKFVNLRGV